MRNVITNEINSAWHGVSGSRKDTAREVEAIIGAITWFPELRVES
jgi:hypothetical protein